MHESPVPVVDTTTKVSRAARAVLAAVATCCASACVDNRLPVDAEQQVQQATKAEIATQLEALRTAAVELRAAAPLEDDDGWSARDDAAAVAAQREAWRRARVAYERVEGAIAVLFPELDAATDARYDAFLAVGVDNDLFDGEGVTGVHAVERIVFSDVIPAQLVAFESALPGYQEARFPATRAEAAAFREELLGRLVDDTAEMARRFEPLTLDAATAWQGVIGSLEEQLEKVDLAGSGEDESRYAQHTLADMRANLAGGLAIVDAFAPLFVEADAEDALHDVEDALAAIAAAYDEIDSDAIPTVPDGWNPDAPSEAHLATPYGRLFALLVEQTSGTADSAVTKMVRAGERIEVR